MTVALDTPTQEAFNKPSRPRTAWLMLVGFLIYTLLVVQRVSGRLAIVLAPLD